MADQISKNNLIVVKLNFRSSWNCWIWMWLENIHIQKDSNL